MKYKDLPELWKCTSQNRTRDFQQPRGAGRTPPTLTERDLRSTANPPGFHQTLLQHQDVFPASFPTQSEQSPSLLMAVPALHSIVLLPSRQSIARKQLHCFRWDQLSSVRTGLAFSGGASALNPNPSLLSLWVWGDLEYQDARTGRRHKENHALSL